ncbi:MAG: AAA family ATPase [Candidatus Melainabacteria bacterium]
MQACPQCDSVNPEESQFCSQCGYKMLQWCPACHFKNLPNQPFCGSCGLQLASEEADIAPGFYDDEPAQTSPPVPSVPAPMPEAPPAAEDLAPVPPPAPAPVAPPALVTEETPPPPAAEAGLRTVQLSIQWRGMDELLAAGMPEDHLNVLKTRSTEKVHGVVSAYGGALVAVKGTWLSFVFRPEPDLLTTGMTALTAAFQLKTTPLADEDGHRLQLAILVSSPAVSPVMAQPAEALLSACEAGHISCDAGLFELLGDQLTTQTQPPVAGQQWYLVIRPEPTVRPSLETPAPPAPTGKPPEPAVSAPTPARAMVPPAETPVKPDPVTTVARDKPKPTPKSLPRFEQPADLPQYAPAIVSVIKSNRIANASYEEASQVLTHELQSLSGADPQGAGGKMVALCASDGLGKTNILHMAREAADPELDRLFWFWGQAYDSPPETPLPLQLWMDVFSTLFGLLPEGQPPNDMRQAIRTTLAELGIQDDGVTATLEVLMGVEPPEPLTVETVSRQGRLAEAVFSVFQALSVHKPVVLVLEDMDRADAASVDVLYALLSMGLTRLPVLLLVSQPLNFYWGGELANTLRGLPYREVVVSDLTADQMHRFLEGGPFGKNIHQVPSDFLTPFFARAKGRPLYLEEALRLLHWEGKLTLDDQGRFMPAPDQPLNFEVFPEDVTILVQRRLNHLADETRYVLQMASVLGERFPLNLLQLMVQMEAGLFGEQLQLLEQQGYIVPSPLQTGRFRHARLWRTVYASMPADLLEKSHQLVSQALENDARQQLAVRPALMAYHAEQGNLPNRAFTYWNMTGVQAAQLGVLEGANMALFAALAYLPAPEEADAESQALRLGLQENLGMLNLYANPGLSASLFRWVAFARQDEPDQARFVETLGFLASALEYEGRYEEALAAVEHSLARVAEDEYPEEAAVLLATKTEYHYTLGRLGPALEAAEQLTTLSDRHGRQRQPETEAAVLNGRLLQARAQLEQFDREAFETLNQLVSLAASRQQQSLYLAAAMARCQGLLNIGRYADVDDQADALLHQIEAMPDNDWFLAQWGLLAIQYHAAFGEAQSADQLLMTVLTRSRRANDYHTWLLAQTWAGHLAALSGDALKARELLEKSVNDSAEYKFAICALLGWRFLAEFELSQGYVDVAHEIAASALMIARKSDIGNRREEYLLTMLCARCLLRQDKLKEAGQLLEGLWPALVETRFSPMIAEGAEKIGDLYAAIALTLSGAAQRKYQERAIRFYDKARHGWLEMQNAWRVRQVQDRQQSITLTVA